MRLPALALLLGMTASARAAPVHDEAFWKNVLATGAPPAGTTAPALAKELVDQLGSTDEAIRDERAYTLLTRWIYEKKLLGPADLAPMVDTLVANLKREGPPDRVVLRSFSALVLSIIAARDAATPFLDQGHWRGLWNAAFAYLREEHDLRGYDPRLGWVHATAHTADLLRFLARSRFLELDDQMNLYIALHGKLVAVPDVFTHGEDERLARALLSLIKRPDFSVAALKSGVAMLTAPPHERPKKLDPIQLHREQNVKNLLAKLLVLVDDIGKPTPAISEAHALLRDSLEKLF